MATTLNASSASHESNNSRNSSTITTTMSIGLQATVAVATPPAEHHNLPSGDHPTAPSSPGSQQHPDHARRHPSQSNLSSQPIVGTPLKTHAQVLAPLKPGGEPSPPLDKAASVSEAIADKSSEEDAQNTQAQDANVGETEQKSKETRDGSDEAAAKDLLLLRTAPSLPSLASIVPGPRPSLQPTSAIHNVNNNDRKPVYPPYPTQVYMQQRRMSHTINSSASHSANSSPGPEFHFHNHRSATGSPQTQIAVPPVVVPSNANLLPLQQHAVGLGIAAAANGPAVNNPLNRRLSVSSIHVFNSARNANASVAAVADARRGSMPVIQQHYNYPPAIQVVPSQQHQQFQHHQNMMRKRSHDASNTPISSTSTFPTSATTPSVPSQLGNSQHSAALAHASATMNNGLPPAKRRYSVAAFYGNNSPTPQQSQMHPSPVIHKIPNQSPLQPQGPTIGVAPSLRLPMFHNMSRAMPAMQAKPPLAAPQQAQLHSTATHPNPAGGPVGGSSQPGSGKQSRSNSVTSLVSETSDADDAVTGGAVGVVGGGNAGDVRQQSSRVSHKIAERARRNKMNELFEELKALLPATAFVDAKASKLEILQKAIDHLRAGSGTEGDEAEETERAEREEARPRDNQ
ncbi:hypothetical protein BC830DRAFT_720079 [Chytriomyces sp. MP71]|nr:hypothetical protein BC830DRAFT_720079 [Chytriomyces sp. MP71]